MQLLFKFFSDPDKYERHHKVLISNYHNSFLLLQFLFSLSLSLVKFCCFYTYFSVLLHHLFFFQSIFYFFLSFSLSLSLFLLSDPSATSWILFSVRNALCHFSQTFAHFFCSVFLHTFFLYLIPTTYLCSQS